MTRAALLLAALGATTALAACNSYGSATPQSAAPARMSLASKQCFLASDIRNHTIADDRTLYLDVRGAGVYRVTMSSACLAAALPTDPIITRQPPGAALVCHPLDLDLSVARGGVASTPCVVQSLAKLTAEEVAALPPKLKP